MTTRVFTLEAKLSRDMQERLHELLREQKQYRNRLVELQRKRADEYQEIRRGFDPRLAEIDARLAALEIEEKRHGLDDDERAERKLLSAEAKPLRKAFNERLAAGNAELKRRKAGKFTHQARAAHEEAIAQMTKTKERWPKEWKAVAASELDVHREELAAREGSGLRQALYAAPDAEMQAAKGAASKAHVPCRPEFVRFDGEGRIKIQMHTGRQPAISNSVLAIINHDVEIREVPRRLPTEHRHPRVERSPDSVRPRKRFFDVRLRVSNEDGNEWLAFSAMAHRVIPDGTVAWVNLVAKHRGAHLCYQLQLELNSESWEQCSPLDAEEAAAVHLGWASNGNGTYQVAYALGTDGWTDKLVLDLRRSTDTGERCDLSGIEFGRSLRSAQDRHFEVARAAMVAWIKTKPAEAKASYTYRDRNGEHSTCLKEECAAIAQWRAPWKLRRAAARLATICGIDVKLPAFWQAWKAERLGRGLDLLDAPDVVMAWAAKHGVKTPVQMLAVYFAFWSRKSLHLESWEQDEWRQARGRRKDAMRAWWRKLERRYASAMVAEWDLTEIPSATRKRVDEDEQTKAARKNRGACAPGEMREIGKQAFGSARWEDAPAGDHALRCSQCGKASRSHPGSSVVTCSCGHAEDRSLRWCRNVLAVRATAKEAAE